MVMVKSMFININFITVDLYKSAIYSEKNRIFKKKQKTGDALSILDYLCCWLYDCIFEN